MPDVLRLLIAAVAGAGLVLAAQHLLMGSATTTNNGGAVPAAARELPTTTSPFVARGPLDQRVAELELAQQRLQAELNALRAQDPLLDAPTNGIAPTNPQVAGARPATGERTATVPGLMAAGLNEQDAQLLVARLDELALARLQANFELRSATNEQDRGRLNASRRAIPRDREAIIEEFGEPVFDQYLYSVGQSNRVAVSSVLRDSAAQDAGLKPGDYLRSLDGEALFRMRDLTNKIRSGDEGSTYALIVERDGELIETWVPGGPLGVRVVADSAPPLESGG